MGKVFKIVLLVSGLALAIGVIAFAKQASENNQADLGSPKTVIDEESGITWEMYGDPVMTETTTDIGNQTGTGSKLDVRTYTVDHGSWIERVRIYDAPPNELDLSPAALATFGAKTDGEIEDLAYLTIGGVDGATGKITGTITRDDEQVRVDAQVFAAQMRNRVVTGGVALDVDSDSIDLVERASELRTSIFEV